MPTATTKRNRQAKSPAKTTPITAAPPPIAVSPYLNPAKTSQTHELIIDAVSDMLLHGGHEDDVLSLIIGAMSHLEHRDLNETFSDEPDRADKIIQRRISEGLPGWKTDLAVAWRANKRAGFPEFEAKSISERIRACSREVLNDRFEDFLRDATPEETGLLTAILNSRNGGIVSPVSGVDEIPLGEAFAFELGQNETYIRLPRGYREKTQKYVDALLAIDGKEAT